MQTMGSVDVIYSALINSNSHSQSCSDGERGGRWKRMEGNNEWLIARENRGFINVVFLWKYFLLSYTMCFIRCNSEIHSVRTFLIASEVFPWPRYTMGVLDKPATSEFCKNGPLNVFLSFFLLSALQRDLWILHRQLQDLQALAVSYKEWIRSYFG